MPGTRTECPPAAKLPARPLRLPAARVPEGRLAIGNLHRSISPLHTRVMARVLT